MKATVIKRLNKRNFPSAEGNIPLPDPHEPGDIIEIVEEVKGSAYIDTTNDRWFKTDKGYFVWSGGTDHASMNERIISASSLTPINWNDIASLELIDKYLQLNETTLLKQYNALSVMATLKVRDGFHSNVPSLQIMVSKKRYSKSNTIPNSIIFKGKSIITDVIEGDIPIIQSAIISPGSKVFQKGLKGNYGTLGLMGFRKEGNIKKNYFMSCYHVFCSTQLKEGIKEITTPPNTNNEIFAEKNSSDFQFGTLVEGVFDPSEGLDVAVVEIFSEIKSDFHPILFSTFPKEGILIPNDSDVTNKMKVYGFGANSNRMEGTLVASRVNVPVLVNGTEYFFKDVIPISKISQPGDSGSLVFNHKGKVLGLLFAGNSTHSYIISISNILNKIKTIALYHENSKI